jgi:hypothetical protein
MRVLIHQTLAILVMASSCSNGPERKYVGDEGVLKLFGGIEIGSHRSQVERVLGRPVLETPEKVAQNPLDGRILVWYLENPPLPPEIPPFMPGAIGVVYVRDHVVEKSLSPQVRR